MRGGLFLRPQVVLALVDRRIVKKSVWPGSEPPTGHLGKGARKFVVIVVSVGPSAEPQPFVSEATVLESYHAFMVSTGISDVMAHGSMADVRI